MMFSRQLALMYHLLGGWLAARLEVRLLLGEVPAGKVAEGELPRMAMLL
jgi:hypothetical protein